MFNTYVGWHILFSFWPNYLEISTFVKEKQTLKDQLNKKQLSLFNLLLVEKATETDVLLVGG